MSIEKAIVNEIKRFHGINKYVNEQVDPNQPDPMAIPPPDQQQDPALAGIPPADPAMAPEQGMDAPPEMVDPNSDPDMNVEEPTPGMDIPENESDGDTEEIDITDLVNTQKTASDKQEEFFNNLFSQMDNMQKKLAEMDSIINKLNAIETKIEKYREKTPEEKLELRSLDSGPYNQKLSDFFLNKEDEFEKTGKEYVLTSDDVEGFDPSEIRDSFIPPSDERFK